MRTRFGGKHGRDPARDVEKGVSQVSRERKGRFLDFAAVDELVFALFPL
jgi:hypothetical protein